MEQEYEQKIWSIGVRRRMQDLQVRRSRSIFERESIKVCLCYREYQLKHQQFLWPILRFFLNNPPYAQRGDTYPRDQHSHSGSTHSTKLGDALQVLPYQKKVYRTV